MVDEACYRIKRIKNCSLEVHSRRAQESFVGRIVTETAFLKHLSIAAAAVAGLYNLAQSVWQAG